MHRSFWIWACLCKLLAGKSIERFHEHGTLFMPNVFENPEAHPGTLPHGRVGISQRFPQRLFQNLQAARSFNKLLRAFSMHLQIGFEMPHYERSTLNSFFL